MALTDHGGFQESMTNQLLYFEPSQEKWHNPAYGGVTPVPGVYESAVWEDKVWLAGGKSGFLEHMYELDMRSLGFTAIQPRQGPTPRSVRWFSFTAVAENRLVLHGGTSGELTGDEVSNETWIFSLQSNTWQTYKGEQDVGRYGHTSHLGPNQSVLVFGGCRDKTAIQSNKNIFTVELQSLSPQTLTMHTIIKHRKKLMPENYLPKIILNDMFGTWQSACIDVGYIGRVHNKS